MSCSFTVLWNSFKRLTQQFSKDEKAALYHDTAVRVYNGASRRRASARRA